MWRTIREKLKQLPLVKEATVSKLYPDRLLIEIEERQPFALWQCDGQVQIVAADGVPLAAMRDQRFIHLPLVVGAGANGKLGQYLALLETAGDLRERIVAGVLVAGRRWTLKTANGIDVLLPEMEPAGGAGKARRPSANFACARQGHPFARFSSARPGCRTSRRGSGGRARRDAFE